MCCDLLFLTLLKTLAHAAGSEHLSRAHCQLHVQSLSTVT